MVTPFEAYQQEWHERGEDLFFETMREHPDVFRGRFPLIYDDSEFAKRRFWIMDRRTLPPRSEHEGSGRGVLAADLPGGVEADSEVA